MSSNSTLNYTIRFENDPILANAPVQVLRVTQTLDADLDPRSFRLGSFGFGDFIFTVPENRAFYQTRLDLRDALGIFIDVFAGVDVATSSIFWNLTAIDPLTGEVPDDGLRGFLPPNVTSPQGEGFVTYTVRPKPTATNGAQIDAAARIFFDTEAPVDTPPIFNTLDVTAPTSTVAALPPIVDDRRFRINWSGADGDVGSGIVSYDVYVRRNNGPFQRWLDDTTLNNAEYTGDIGSTYSFYAIATDAVGNSEPLVDQAESTIAVGTHAPQLRDIRINDGSAQRSMVTSITFQFSSPVKLGRDAIRLNRVGGAPLGFGYSLSNPSRDGTTWVMTFSGTGIPGNSVTDGSYEIRVNASRITDRYGQALSGGNQSMGFHRLFGDVDGNRSVDTLDLLTARRSLGAHAGDPGYPWWLDSDADSAIDMDDLLAVRAYLGRRLR